MIQNLIKARGRAHKIWEEFDFPHPTEVPLEDLAMYRNVLVVAGGLNGAEGRLVRDSTGGVIRVRDDILQDGRRRFTIAHELGHWELHTDHSQFLCSESDMRDYGRSSLELEANHFAAELLMPTVHFRPRCQGEPCLHDVKELAQDFCTSLTATAIRVADLSKFPIQIIWHENDRVRWCYSKESKKLPYVNTNREVPRYSSARLPRDQVANHMETYESADWFPQLQHRKPEVAEMTIRANRLGGGLTMMWFLDR